MTTIDLSSKLEVVEHTHIPSGITIFLKHIGHIEKTIIFAEADGKPGQIIKCLSQPGVGVMKWKGVKKLVVTGKSSREVVCEYSTAALDAVADKVDGFGAWFNDTLLNHCGLLKPEIDTSEEK